MSRPMSCVFPEEELWRRRREKMGAAGVRWRGTTFDKKHRHHPQFLELYEEFTQ